MTTLQIRDAAPKRGQCLQAEEDEAASSSWRSLLPASYPTAELDLLQMSRSHSEGAQLDRGCSWFQNLTDGFMEASRKAAPAALPWDRTARRGTLRNPQGRKLISRTSLRLHTR